jgi:hypothetical protein
MSNSVHVIRHGEVHNPEKILYGRQPGWRLSERGQEMAQVLGQWSKSIDLGALHVSPLQRAQETAAPIAAAHSIAITTEDRLIEAANIFEGKPFGIGDTCGIHGDHHGASHMLNRLIACLLQSLKLIKQPTVKMQSVYLINYLSGFCEVQLRDDACYTTHESVNALWHL